MPSPIHVTSEIGKLKTVMLHRPGREIENITPDSMYRLLFDDIPYLPIAQEEHDYFAQTLRDQALKFSISKSWLLRHWLTKTLRKNSLTAWLLNPATQLV